MPAKGTATFHYPGAKTTLAPWIIDHFPDHQCYVEPFGGSASVLIQKTASTAEVYNDLDSHVTEIFLAIRDHGEELQEWLESTPYSREVFSSWMEDFREGEWPDSIVARAGRHIALRYMSYGGKIPGTFSTGKNPGHPVRANPRQLKRAAENVIDLRDRLREVTIEHQDYRTVVDRYDSGQTLFYCDPPYYTVESKYYDEGEGFDHEELLSVLTESNSLWIVSYSDLPNCFDGGSFYTTSRAREWTLDSGETSGSETLVMNFDPQQRAAFSPENQSLAAFATDGGSE